MRISGVPARKSKIARAKPHATEIRFKIRKPISKSDCPFCWDCQFYPKPLLLKCWGNSFLDRCTHSARPGSRVDISLGFEEPRHHQEERRQWHQRHPQHHAQTQNRLFNIFKFWRSWQCSADDQFRLISPTVSITQPDSSYIFQISAVFLSRQSRK